MLLHSSAGLHGHKYSADRPATAPQQAPPRRRNLFVRSALRPLSDPSATTSRSSAAAPARRSLPAPSLGVAQKLTFPSSPPSQPPSPTTPPVAVSGVPLGPRATIRTVLLDDGDDDDNDGACPPSTSSRPTSTLIPKRAVSVRFTDAVEVMDGPPRNKRDLPGATAGPPTGPVGDSIPENFSDYSETSTLAERRTRRVPRASTKYVLAQPAPRLATKQRRLVQIRPRLLLQLHRIAEPRPKPAFDALPSSLVSGPVIAPRLARKFARLLHMKPELGLDDIIVARSEDYDAPDSTGSDSGTGDELDRRELLGVVSPVPPKASECQVDGVVEIALDNDSIWTGVPLRNGSYEFTRIDDSGRTVTARWARQAVGNRNSTGGTAVGALAAPIEFKYVFSILDPSSRRHPILATLTPTSLEIYDTYTALSPSSGRYPPTPSATATTTATTPASERQILTVDDDTRTLIITSAVWVTMRSQFSWPFARPAATSRSRNSFSGRRNSLSRGGPNWAPPSPTSSDRAATFPPPRANFPPCRSFSLDDRSLVMAQPPSPPGSIDAALSTTATAVRGSLAGLPRRAVSTGAAFMRRRRRAAAITESSAESSIMESVVSEETVMPPAASTFQPPLVVPAPVDPPAKHIAVLPPLDGRDARVGFRGRIKEWRNRLTLRIKGL